MNDFLELTQQALQVKFFKTGSGQGPHSWIHEKSVPFTIIAQAVTGSYEVSSPRGSVRVSGDEAFLASAGTPLRIVHHADAGALSMKFRYIHFQFLIFETIDVFSLYTLPLKTDALLGKRITGWMDELSQIPNENTIPQLAKRQILIYQMIEALLAISTPLNNGSWVSSLTNELLPMIKYIQEYMSQPIKLENFLARLPFSRSALFKIFKCYFGLTPMEYVKVVRLNEAYRLICSTSHSLSFIAEQCGFANLQHFSREFKLKFHTTPSEARRVNSLWIG
jgi:AraC-like DNA-binding protein